MFTPALAGPHDPLLTAPARRAGSVRRTTSIDSFREPDGSVVTVDARARDQDTGADGGARPVASEQFAAQLNQSDSTILRLERGPGRADLHRLLGGRVGPGFRGAVSECLGATIDPGSLTHHLLDDWPGASLVSGYALQRAAERNSEEPLRVSSDHASAAVDICAGWAADASMMIAIRDTGLMPTPLGPMVPTEEPSDDPDAWHAIAPLRPGGTRRRRRTDLWPIDDGTLGFETHFRDSYAEDDDRQSVVHEYLVDGTLARDGHVVTAIDAQVRVLPWKECPSAIESAQRLVGVPVSGLRALVRTEFTGTSTCTHLNDTLRTLEDLAGLADRLPG